MAALLMLALKPLELLNVNLLRVAKWLATALLALMVAIISFQIIMRLIEPAGWTTPAAKFLMLWMIGLAAPIGYRTGGFVGIDLLERALPRIAAQGLTLLILGLCCLVMVLGVQLGWDAVDSFTGKGTIPGFRVELSWLGLKDFQFRNWHAFASLFVGFCLLLLVNIELILRHLIRISGHEAKLTPIAETGGID